MRDTTVPIYLIAGFLESGKTTFLRFTLEQDYFRIDGKTLLILCEEGEEEYDTAKLARYNTVIEHIGSEEDFTTEKLETLQLLHKPERVVLEYNGMWLVSKLMEMKTTKSSTAAAIPAMIPVKRELRCLRRINTTALPDVRVLISIYTA